MGFNKTFLFLILTAFPLKTLGSEEASKPPAEETTDKNDAPIPDNKPSPSSSDSSSSTPQSGSESRPPASQKMPSSSKTTTSQTESPVSATAPQDKPAPPQVPPAGQQAKTDSNPDTSSPSLLKEKTSSNTASIPQETPSPSEDLENQEYTQAELARIKFLESQFKELERKVEGTTAHEQLESFEAAAKRLLKTRYGYKSSNYAYERYYTSSYSDKESAPLKKPTREDAKKLFLEDWTYEKIYDDPIEKESDPDNIKSLKRRFKLKIEKTYEDLLEKYKKNQEKIEKEKKEKDIKEKSDVLNEAKDTFINQYKKLIERDVYPTELTIFKRLNSPAVYLTCPMKDLFNRSIFIDVVEEEAPEKKEKKEKIGNVLFSILGEVKNRKEKKNQASSQNPNNTRQSTGFYQNGFLEGFDPAPMIIPIAYYDADEEWSTSSSYSSTYDGSSYNRNQYNASPSVSSRDETKKPIPLKEILFEHDQYLRFAIDQISQGHTSCSSRKDCLNTDKKKLDEILNRTNEKNKGWQVLKEIRLQLDKVNTLETGFVSVAEALEEFKNNSYERLPVKLKNKDMLFWLETTAKREQNLKSANKVSCDKVKILNLTDLMKKYRVVKPRKEITNKEEKAKKPRIAEELVTSYLGGTPVGNVLGALLNRKKGKSAQPTPPNASSSQNATHE